MSAAPAAADPHAASGGFEPARSAVAHYGDALLRRSAAQFGRQRVKSEPDELRDYIVAAIENPVLIDRTLKGLTPAARRALRFVGMSRQQRWRMQAFAD